MDVMLKSVIDGNIVSKDADAFGHQDFTSALRSLIGPPQNSPPCSIGLLQTWGTGKTRFKTGQRRNILFICDYG